MMMIRCKSGSQSALLLSILIRNHSGPSKANPNLNYLSFRQGF
jgi:hypothetical protein